MAKRIIFCADGTWSGPAKQTGVEPMDGDDAAGEIPPDGVTNVVKLFENLDGAITAETKALQNEHEKVLSDAAGNPLQVAKYLHGVGDSKNLLIKLLGGALGLGVIGRIVRGYTFISRNYEPGDEIHITGFSRGAYTARALAGMISTVGLLDKRTYDVNDKMESYKLGIGAWHKSKGITLSGSKHASAFANKLLDVVETLLARDVPDNKLIPDVPIRSVGVWDTVGSLGIPVYAGDMRFDLFRFADTTLSAKVANGFHAMAIDEQRLDFPVTRWDARQGVTQVWFIGAHGDVGGGYSSNEGLLSDITLGWMMQKLAGVGVKFATPPRYNPREANPLWPLHAPWERTPFNLAPLSPRQPAIDDIYHPTVTKRWQEDATYRPFKFAGQDFSLDRLRLDA
jgi:glutathione S-transferase